MRPDLAGRIAAVERARHPRPKVCAGGLIPRTMAALKELQINLDVPSVEVFGGTARTEAGEIGLKRSIEPLCTIVRRNEFDALLARHASAAGLEIIDRTRVRAIEQRTHGVRIDTDNGVLDARVLVGADGSGSRVRTVVFGRSKQNIGRALVAEVPVRPDSTEEFLSRQYRFDFNCVAAGVQGYCWSFPCLIDGRAHLNVGIYDKNPGAGSGCNLVAQLRGAFPEIDSLERGDGRLPIKAFPIRWYEPRDQYVRGNTILAGDAAGVDPLMGEGISYALEHGKIAAAAIARFLAGETAALEGYGEELHRGLMGRKLRRLAFAARCFYSSHHRFYFRLAGLSRRMQRLGVDWYNGADRIDELSIVQATLRLISGAV